jgi:hypothetical protein
MLLAYQPVGVARSGIPVYICGQDDGADKEISTMATSRQSGLANRLGYSIGRVIRFFLVDSNSLRRWVKRAVLLVLLTAGAVQFLSWFAGAVLSLISFGLILFVLAKGDLSPMAQVSECMQEREDGYRYGLSGYGYYVNGARIDGDDN